MFESSNEGSEGSGSAAQEVADFYNLLMRYGQMFGEDEFESEAELYEDEDEEGPFESLLRHHAPEIEAGLMPGWKLDRSQPGALLWTTPAGRQYRSTLDGSSYEPYRH